MNRLSSTKIGFVLFSMGAVSGCSGEPPIEKAILGTWVQETPTSTTSSGVQTLTTDTVLRLKKNGETHLTRNLDITGPGLPESGIRVSVDLKGEWALTNGQLTHNLTNRHGFKHTGLGG